MILDQRVCQEIDDPGDQARIARDEAAIQRLEADINADRRDISEDKGKDTGTHDDKGGKRKKHKS